MSTEPLPPLNDPSAPFRPALERISKAIGITTPLLLIAAAKDNTENFADILARLTEEHIAGLEKDLKAAHASHDETMTLAEKLKSDQRAIHRMHEAGARGLQDEITKLQSALDLARAEGAVMREALTWRDISTLDRALMQFVLIEVDDEVRLQLWNPYQNRWENAEPVGSVRQNPSEPERWMPIPPAALSTPMAAEWLAKRDGQRVRIAQLEGQQKFWQKSLTEWEAKVGDLTARLAEAKQLFASLEEVRKYEKARADDAERQRDEARVYNATILKQAESAEEKNGVLAARVERLEKAAQAAADVMERAKKLLCAAGLIMEGGTISGPYNVALGELLALLQTPDSAEEKAQGCYGPPPADLIRQRQEFAKEMAALRDPAAQPNESWRPSTPTTKGGDAHATERRHGSGDGPAHTRDSAEVTPQQESNPPAAATPGVGVGYRPLTKEELKCVPAGAECKIPGTESWFPSEYVDKNVADLAGIGWLYRIRITPPAVPEPPVGRRWVKKMEAHKRGDVHIGSVAYDASFDGQPCAVESRWHRATETPVGPLSHAALEVGSCTCLTKTNDPAYHDPRCPFRLLRDAEALLAQLREASADKARLDAWQANFWRLTFQGVPRYFSVGGRAWRLDLRAAIDDAMRCAAAEITTLTGGAN